MSAPMRRKFRISHFYLMLAVLIMPILILGCSNGKNQGEIQERDMGSLKPELEENQGELPTPSILLNYKRVEPPENGNFQMAVRTDHIHSVQIYFKQKLDMASAEGRIEISLPLDQYDVEWRGGTSTEGQDWTSADIHFQDPRPGESVKIRFKPGIRSEDGRVLAEEQRFSVDFVEGTDLKITLQGPSYQIWGQTKATLEENSEFPGLFRPGPAELRLEFTHPVDPQRTWNLIRKQLADIKPEISIGQPEWDKSNRIMMVTVGQKTVSDKTWTSFQTHHLNISELTDAKGFRIPEDFVPLTWAAPPAVPVLRGLGLPKGGEQAGMVAGAYGLQPVNLRGFWGDRILTWLNFGDAGDFYKYVLLWWDLAKGTYQRLGDIYVSPYLRADRQGRDRVLVGMSHKILRFNLGNELNTGHYPSETLYQPARDRVIIGTAVAPNGQIAVFEAEKIYNHWKQDGAVDLVLLDESGKVLRRVKSVADLATGDGDMPFSIHADWSADSSSLAFVHHRLGEERSKEGYPKTIAVTLSIWQTGQTSISDIVTGLQSRGESTVAWRTGSSQVMVMQDGHWRLVTVEGKVSIGEPLPIPEGVERFFWSPDGRYVAWQAAWQEQDSGILDLTTGEKSQGQSNIPLGWDLETNEFYWYRLE